MVSSLSVARLTEYQTSLDAVCFSIQVIATHVLLFITQWSSADYILYYHNKSLSKKDSTGRMAEGRLQTCTIQ